MVVKKKETQKTVQKISKSEQIWNQIKDLPINVFGLPNQTVSDHAKPNLKFEEELHIELSAQAALPVIEDKLKEVGFNSGNFELETRAQFTVLVLDKPEL